MPHGAAWWHARTTARRSASSASTGEPWNPEPYRWLFEARRRRDACPSSTTPAAPRSRAASSSCFPIAPIKPCSFAGPIPGMAAEVLRRRRPSGARAGGRAGRHAAMARDDRRASGRTPRATRRLTGRAGRTCGRMATGPSSTRTASGSSTAARTTRSRSRASGWGPPRWSRCWSVIRRSRRRPPSACRTRSRARRWSASRCCAPGRRSEPLRAELIEKVVQAMGKAIKPERVLFAARAAQDPQRQDHAPGDPRDLPGQGARRPLLAGQSGRREGDRGSDLAEDLLHRVHAFVHGLADLLGGRGAAAGSARGRAGGWGPRPPRSKRAGSAARGCPRYFPRSRKWCAPRC